MKKYQFLSLSLLLLFVFFCPRAFANFSENIASLPHNYLTRIEVDSETGELIKYYDAQGGCSLPESVTDEGVLASSEYFIRKYSIFPDKNAKLAEPFMRMEDGSQMIHWDHYINGVKSEEDYINVLVAQKRIVGFKKVWKTPDNVSTTPSISKQEAMNIALRNIKNDYARNQNLFPFNDMKFYIPNETILTVSSSGLYWNVLIHEKTLNFFGSNDYSDYYAKVDATIGDVVRYEWNWRGQAKNPIDALCNIFTEAWEQIKKI